MVFDRFLKSKKLYMLFLLPFLALAIATIGFYWQPVRPHLSLNEGVIYAEFLRDLSAEHGRYTGLGITLAIAYFMFYVNARYKFLPQISTLPATIYILLTTGLVLYQGFSYIQIATLLMAFAFAALQEAINDIKSNSSIYSFGFLTALAILVYPKSVLLFPWAICVLMFSGRSTLKDISAILLGLITPVFFTCFYYFWTDNLQECIQRFQNSLLAGEFLTHPEGASVIFYGLLVLLLLVSLYGIIVFYPISVVNQRRGILSLLSMLCFCSLSFLVIPDIYPDMLYMLFMPLTYIYSQQLINQRIGLLGDIFLFLLFLTGVVFCNADFFTVY